MANTYYQDELRYLREAGPEFARANPEIARYLADRGSDPDVERLLEGLAFLCGRIRQKLDDELPEFTAGLMGLLWPHYLRPIPSMTILELLPDVAQLQAPLEVPAGSRFASIPVDGTRCIYRSCWPVTLRPLAIDFARLEAEPAKPVRVTFGLSCAEGLGLADLQLGRLRLHLAGDAAASFTLYQLLVGHVHEIRVSTGRGGRRGEVHTLPGSAIEAAGLAESAGVIPYPVRSFPGYRFLQEYFSLKERFLFVDLVGLDAAVEALGAGERLEVSCTLNRRLESVPHVSAENVRLHCVPIVNLFQHPGEPLRISHERVNYLLQPSRSGVADRRHAEIYSVDLVTGVGRAGSVETHEYVPFDSFAHESRTGPSSDASYYSTSIAPSVQGDDPRLGTDQFISFTCPAEGLPSAQGETISLEFTCTNRHLPGQLRAGDIREPTDTSPPDATFRNLSRPTRTIRPPIGRALHWRLLSHMSLNYVSLANERHFRELLRVYDFQAEYDAQRALAQGRLLEGITRMRSTFAERVLRGAPVRGCEIEMELDEDHFAGEGDAFLFASVLNRFFSLYVTLNSFSQFTARFRRSGRIYRFAPRWGDQLTPVEEREGALA